MTKINQTLSLPRLLLGYISSPGNKILQKTRLYKKSDLIPEKIGEYSFVKIISPSFHEFQIAIYKNSKGKKVLAKIWGGYLKDYEYYTLVNEINLYKIFTNVLTRMEKKQPNKLKNTSIPKLIDVYQTKRSVVLLIDYIEGKNGLGLSAEKKYKTYNQVAEYLKFIGKNMTADEKQVIGERPLSSIVFIYPAIVLVSLISNPQAWRKILTSIPKFINAIPSILTTHENQLIHRDFHFDNIIIKSKKVFIIDFQFSLFSLYLMDVATMLRFVWNDKKFVNKILNDQNSSKTSLFRNDIFSLLTLHSATHGLTDSSLSPAEKNIRVNYLDFAINKNLIA